MTHPIAGVTTYRSSTRIESDLSEFRPAEPSRIERARDWLTDTIKDTWEQVTNDKGGDAPKTGVTEVTVGDEQHRLAITIGTALNDVIEAAGLVSGGSGDDSLRGQAGDDILLGGSDRDTLIGGAGADVLDGGDGSDLASYQNANGGVVADLSTECLNSGEASGDVYYEIEGLIGSTYDDRLTGNDRANTLIGLLGNDVLRGLDGDDVLRGGLGADVLDGGLGYDEVTYAEATGGVIVNLTDASQNTGEAFGDRYISIEDVTSSAFADKIIGNDLNNQLKGNDGADVLDGGNGENTLLGGAGNDRLYSGADADVLNGGTDFDTVTYYNRLTGVQVYLWNPSKNTGAAKGDTYSGIEVIDGTRFADVMEGTDLSSDIFWGDDGNDALKGWDGADTLSGGDGNDTLEGGAGADRFNGGTNIWETDYASYAGSVEALQVYLWDPSRNTGEAAGDVYISIEGLIGSAYGDVLEGNGETNQLRGEAGHDRLKGLGGHDGLYGGSGDDTLSGGAGADRLDGGEAAAGALYADIDYASYADAAFGVLVDLLYTSRNTGDAAGDMFISIEGLIGSAHADQFYGTGVQDRFKGEAGDDRLEGRGGGDTLDGGEGRDHAVYWSAASGVIANLTAGVGTAGDAAGDKFYGIEGLEGSNYADYAAPAMGQGNTLYGWGGNDLLLGEGDVYLWQRLHRGRRRRRHDLRRRRP